MSVWDVLDFEFIFFLLNFNFLILGSMHMWLILDLLVTFVFFLLICMALLVYGAMFSSLFRDAPFVPSAAKTADAMVALAQVRAEERVIDLGSGYGTILFAAAKQGAITTGYEISWVLCFMTRVRAFFTGMQKRVRVVRGDFFRADLKNADVVMCYLFPEALTQLVPRIENELRPGTRVVSSLFTIPGQIPAQVIHIAKHPVFLYHIPRK